MTEGDSSEEEADGDAEEHREEGTDGVEIVCTRVMMLELLFGYLLGCGDDPEVYSSVAGTCFLAEYQRCILRILKVLAQCTKSKKRFPCATL